MEADFLLPFFFGVVFGMVVLSVAIYRKLKK